MTFAVNDVPTGVPLVGDHAYTVDAVVRKADGTLSLRLRNFIASAQSDGKSNKVSLDVRQWQALIDLQARVAEYLREVGEP